MKILFGEFYNLKCKIWIFSFRSFEATFIAGSLKEKRSILCIQFHPFYLDPMYQYLGFLSTFSVGFTYIYLYKCFKYFINQNSNTFYWPLFFYHTWFYLTTNISWKNVLHEFHFLLFNSSKNLLLKRILPKRPSGFRGLNIRILNTTHIAKYI